MRKKILTSKQELFIRYYISNNFNGTLAAKLAGYKGNDTQLAITANKNLNKDKIANRIEQHKANISQITDIEAVTVIQELSKVALVSAADLFNDKGELIPIKQLPKHVAAAVASFEVIKHPANGSTTTKIKLHSKLAALGDLCKHLGLYKADEIPDKNLMAKALDAKKAEDIKRIAEIYYSHKYLAKPVESTENPTENTGNSNTLQGESISFTDSLQGESTEHDFSQSDPVTPQGGGA